MPNGAEKLHTKSKAFAKLDRFLTTRAQEAIDKKKQEDVLVKKYLGPPGEGEVLKYFVSIEAPEYLDESDCLSFVIGPFSNR